jgi:filamentous hemagglutinin family protein
MNRIFYLQVWSLASVLSIVSTGLALAVPTGLIGTDGSLGASTVLSGPNFQIPASLGKVEGNNLFHSFDTFDLVQGESATFSGPANIRNILARVTGGSPTFIDGTINSSIAGANLYFLNPAGVMFGANAAINVTGSFVVSTAGYANFDDGTSFYAGTHHSINDAGLSSASVSAFGFLSSAPQPISFVGSHLTTKSGQGLHVIAGDINLDGASLSAPAATLTFFSAGQSGEVPFSLAHPGAAYATTAFMKLGSVSLTNLSSAGIDGAGGGSVVIRGGRMVVDHSKISSNNFGPVIGGAISVQADQLTLSHAGVINSDSFGGAAAGNVHVEVAQNLEVSGTGSQISANTESSGNGGVVTVHSNAIDLNGGDIFANTDSIGHGGTVQVNAVSLSMEGNARVSSVCNGSGSAGTVNLTLAGSLVMGGTSGILANTDTSGNGGNIGITASQIEMTGRSLISANTFFSTGRGGNITVTAQSLAIDGDGTQAIGSLGITALSLGSGNAGTVTVTTNLLSLSGAGIISGASFGDGRGGDVRVNCVQGEVAGQSLITASSTLSNAGSIEITAADSFTLANGGSVSTSAGHDGGSIQLVIGRLLYLDDSNIQAFAGAHSSRLLPSPPLGGNIDIDPEFVILNNSFISANDLGLTGKDGHIVNSADFFFTSNSFLHATGTIETTAPDLDLGHKLVTPPTNLVDTTSQLRESCARSVNHEFSTLTVVGRLGTETAPEELQPDFGMTETQP